jgi:hypothetical protein
VELLLRQLRIDENNYYSIYFWLVNQKEYDDRIHTYIWRSSCCSCVEEEASLRRQEKEISFND